jgi:FixJ family two-component response regulator
MTFNKPSTPLVYLVDDEFAVRDSLTLLLESRGQNVRSFESAADFLKNYDANQAGCLILDVRMPSMTGLELQEELLKRNITLPIIFISGHADIPDSAKAFRAGAVDFLEKPFNNETLLQRIEEAIDKNITSRQQRSDKQIILDRFKHLTVREKEVMTLIVTSHSNKEAAKILDVSNRTIDVHRAHVMEKMQAGSLQELMVMAVQCDLISA